VELLRLVDIAEMLGMSRAGADKLVKREADFPAPMVLTSGARVWDRAAVEAWARAKGRLP